VATPSFRKILAEFQTRFEAYLDTALPNIGELSEVVRYAALGGGKRLRPFLMVQTTGIFDNISESVWENAAALECTHVYSLIHDDLPCMDDDDLRRGKPTVHIAYDEAMAVLAGDALLTRAFEIMANLSIPAHTSLRLVAELAKAAGEAGMIGGQVLDIRASGVRQDETSITRLQNFKTGALIRYAVWSGAVLGGASEKETSELTAFADDLGLLFQVTDDILDETGDASKVGKAVNKDKNLGKATFVSILGLDGAKNKATILADRAKRRLEPFGERAHILVETVDYVRNREH